MPADDRPPSPPPPGGSSDPSSAGDAPAGRPRGRRVMFARPPPASPEPEQSASDNTSFMMLDTREAERIAERAGAHSHYTHRAGAGAPGAPPPKYSARELASGVDKGLQRAHIIGERAYTRAAGLAAPAVDAARRVGRLPSLAAWTGFGGRRAPNEEADSPGGGDPGGGGGGGGGAGGRPGRGQTDAAARVVHINDEARNSHFGSNYVSTTKYKLWSALPMFLFEQFSRFSNAYFLVVGIGYTIDAVSPIFTVGRYSTLWVLAVVVMISGVKEGLEDYHRYREDRRVNRAEATVVGCKERNRWATVHVGDIITVHDREHLPADIVLVASASDDGLAYIETKQLDGESNLKVKVVPQAISAAFKNESSALLTKGRVECEGPNDRLYKFNGRVVLDKVPSLADPASYDPDREDNANLTLNEPVPLGPENLMIRGSSLRNTEWVMGVVVYTGRDTKLMQNVKPRPRKNSRLERETNRHYFMCLFLQIFVIITLSIRATQKCDDLFGGGRFAWYLKEEVGCQGSDSVLKVFTFFIIFSALIPISLYVSMEVVRAFQVYFIEHDTSILDPESGIRTEVRTSNLNEELGVVHHVFTDKTGTLTANRMDFKKCSINGRVYEMSESPNVGATKLSDMKDALQAGPESSAVETFSPRDMNDAEMTFRLLAICHSVVAEAADNGDAASEHTEASSGSSGMRRIRMRRRRRKEQGHSDDGTSHGRRASGSRARPDAPPQYQPGSVNSSSDAPGGTGGGNRVISSLNDSMGADTTAMNYQASSPDEAALVQAARSQGFTFLSRSNRDVVIDVFGRQETHELLETIEFDSARKRMSVITRDPDGRLHIFTKGADAMIFARLAPGQSAETTERHLHDFAVEGLRTLCLAYAELDDKWFDDWHRRYRQAAADINNRDDAMAAVADEIERDLTLLGATAIEDKLQDGVPETLNKLEQAGVKIWVLTGDKQETAINIGLSCGAIDEGMDVVLINENNLEDTGAQIDRALGRWSAMRADRTLERKLGLVIDGQTLHYALEPELQKKFMVVAALARSVIACRVSPKQKTEIVELVRRHEPEKVTLAIGDGANDVGMIQAAHVGVGIVGLEGQEAKLASDFSIGQFRFLARLMLVHGRWNYKRLSKMVLYTIYKNAVLTLCEMYWASFSAFSGQPLLDPWMGGLYNLLVTSLPPVVLGIFDQELGADYALAFPEIYAKGQRNTAYNFRVFLSWISASVWQSAIIFFVTYWGFGDGKSKNGQLSGMWAFGTVVFSAVIVTVHAMLLVMQSSWNRLTASLFAISFLSWFLFGPLISWRTIALTGNLSPPLYAVTHRMFAEPKFWLVMMLCPVLCTSPNLLYKYSKRRRRPNIKMLVQELLRAGKTREEITGEPQKPLRRVPSYDPKRPAPTGGPVTFVVKGEREYQFSGFNFEPGETGAVLRHTFHTSRGLRRRRMRVLKRAGSDTELDVDGVKTTDVDAPDDYMQQTTDWVSGHAARAVPGQYVSDDRIVEQRRSGIGAAGAPGSRPPANYGDDIAGHPAHDLADAAPGTATNPSHRRSVSDGAVLTQDRIQRLEGHQHYDGTYFDGGDESDDVRGEP